MHRDSNGAALFPDFCKIRLLRQFLYQADVIYWFYRFRQTKIDFCDVKWQMRGHVSSDGVRP